MPIDYTYTPKFTFKKIINLAWNKEENGYNPVHIDKVVAITAASMFGELTKVAPEKWYTRLATEFKKFVKTNRRRMSKLSIDELETMIEEEWVKEKHVAEKRTLISSAPLYHDYDGEYVILEPDLADNFRKHLLLPGEKPIAEEDFKPSKQSIEKHEREAQIQREREELLQAILDGRNNL